MAQGQWRVSGPANAMVELGFLAGLPASVMRAGITTPEAFSSLPVTGGQTAQIRVLLGHVGFQCIGIALAACEFGDLAGNGIDPAFTEQIGAADTAGRNQALAFPLLIFSTGFLELAKKNPVRISGNLRRRTAADKGPVASSQ